MQLKFKHATVISYKGNIIHLYVKDTSSISEIIEEISNHGSFSYVHSHSGYTISGILRLFETNIFLIMVSGMEEKSCPTINTPGKECH